MAQTKQQTFPGFGIEDESPKSKRLSSVPKANQTRSLKNTAQNGGPTVLEAADLAGKTVYVIDSHSLIYQVFHALRDMTDPNGKPINAVYGFTRDILDIISKRKPDLLICCFDHGRVTFRNEMYSEYKANRDPMPDDLRSQIPEIKRILTALNIPILTLPNYEADDIMATLATQIDENGGKCVLVTSDKDCRQLISDNVCLYLIRKNLMYRAPHLATDWGIRPDQVVDFQAMVGDSVDNVPGIPTIGPKTATQLLEQFDTLENVLANTDQIKGKKAERIAESNDLAYMSRRLVELNRNTPIDIDWSSACIGGMDIQKTLEICSEFGFRSLKDRVEDLAPLAKPVQWDSDYQLIRDETDLIELVERLTGLPRFAVDTETTSINPRWAEIVGYSFAWETGEAAYVPVRSPKGQPAIDPERAAELLRPILESDHIEKIGQNLKYDQVVLRGAGINLRGPLFDTMVADYLLEPGRSSHGIDELALRYFNHKTTKISELIGTGKNQIRMDEVDVELVSDYASEDADIPLRLYSVLKEKLVERDLFDLFNDLEMPLVSVLAEMEFNGISVETSVLDELSQELGQRIAELETEIHELAGREFNIDSPAQLAEILFDQLKLPAIKRTKTGRSTDVEVLNQLADSHPIPARVIEYRQAAKLKNTYTDALVRQVNPATNRVHTSFMQDVARTGRLSSKDPNLQNIPIRTETGRRIRQAFVAENQGWQLISADYSQIELRVLAHFCEDRALISAFNEGKDIHTAVAAQINNISDGEVTQEMRRKAKAVNFGIIYGQSAFGLAKEIGIDKGEAAEFIDEYFGQYPSVDQYINSILENASKNGYVSTILRRQRPVEGVRNPTEKSGISRNRNLAERIAVNTVIQGSAADLIKVAMINVHRRLQVCGLRALLLLQIHDELVLEAHPDDVDSVLELLLEEMENACQLHVPLKVDTRVSRAWG